LLLSKTRDQRTSTSYNGTTNHISIPSASPAYDADLAVGRNTVPEPTTGIPAFSSAVSAAVLDDDDPTELILCSGVSSSIFQSPTRHPHFLYETLENIEINSNSSSNSLKSVYILTPDAIPVSPINFDQSMNDTISGSDLLPLWTPSSSNDFTSKYKPKRNPFDEFERLLPNHFVSTKPPTPKPTPPKPKLKPLCTSQPLDLKKQYYYEKYLDDVDDDNLPT